MKILHIGLMVDGKNVGLAKDLKEASTFYHEISTGDKDLNNKIINAINKHEFDFAFFQIQSPGIVQPLIFQKIKDKGIFTVNWSGDIRTGTPTWYLKTNADLTLFSNERDVNNMRQAGLQSDFLQIGIDPNIFNKHGINEARNRVVFMGNNYGSQFPLGRERQILANMLVNGGNAVYGGYNGAKGNLNGNQIGESIVYNNADIGINHSHYKDERYTSDRMFRILGSGCFCLSHYYPGIERDFEIGKHLDTYKDFREMNSKIDHYLSNPTERERIAKHGFNHCHKNFTYKNMTDNLIELVKQYR